MPARLLHQPSTCIENAESLVVSNPEPQRAAKEVDSELRFGP